ncbi:MAG TPA: 3-phosphoshikimate 1-carboxyvinyltransferase [Rectinemataceae bacterium]|nr:3-phosphoshikimate 1-carboxyvinyltransferase [Rectinemataceae bacterium]
MIRRCERKIISGTIDAPSSKSSMQRAVACAMLSRGRSVLRSAELCADSESALRLAQALGASARIEGSSVSIDGSPLFGKNAAAFSARGEPQSERGSLLSAERLELDCGESGLCMRMFSPIAALLASETRLTGRGSLALRPMGMVEGSLRALGAECRSVDGHSPLLIAGPLEGGCAEIDASESSQLLTGLLIALPLAPRDSELKVARAVSKGYLDLTIDTCEAFGVEIQRNEDFSKFSIRGGQRYKPADFAVEGDWSGAAFLIVAAAIAAGESKLAIRGLRMDSSQPDRLVVEAARAAGASLAMEEGVLFVGRDRLEAFDFDATDCPDLFPPLAALASACAGESVIRGVHRLRGKESDRAASLKATFDILGAPVRLEGDSMIVEGGSMRGGEVRAFGDHRIAMSAAVAALGATDGVTIHGSECVSKSWPGFFEDLGSISG